jgi:hypothetical protein
MVGDDEEFGRRTESAIVGKPLGRYVTVRAYEGERRDLLIEFRSERSL